MYLEETIKDLAEIDIHGDNELLRREQEQERLAQAEYKEKKRRMRLYNEYHKTFKNLIYSTNIPTDPDGIIYRRMKDTYDENIGCIDDVEGYSMINHTHLMISSCILFLLILFTVLFLMVNELVSGAGATTLLLLATVLFTGLFYTIAYPIFLDYYKVRSRLRLAAECAVVCRILEVRERVARGGINYPPV